MKRMFDLFTLLAVYAVFSTDAFGYSWTDGPWCSESDVFVAPAYRIDVASFTSRGISNQVVDQIVDAATIWNHMPANISISYGGNDGVCYGQNSICARNRFEDDSFEEDDSMIGYTHVIYDESENCNLYYYQVIRADAGLGYTAATSKSADTGFVSVSMHEFGHSMTLGDPPNVPFGALMSYAPTSRAHTDDAIGLYSRYGFGLEQLKTRLAYDVNYSTGSLSTFSPIVQLGGYQFRCGGVRPSIVGNWHQGIGGSYNWDYAAVWTNYTTLTVALFRDGPDGTLQVRAVTSIPSGYTVYSPSIAIGDANQILVVWKKYSTSQSNYISIARIQVNVQGNGFDSIDTSTLSLWQALSEPVVTFMPGRYRFIISFVMDGTQVYGDDDRHRIAAMVSMNAAGTAWQAPYTYEGNDPNFPEFVSSPWHAPAITCYNGLLLTNTCLMMYKQFRTSDTRWIDQQAFSMDSGNTRIISSTTDWSTWNYSHAELTIASSLYDWLYTHVYYNGGKGRMMYRIKRFSQGAGGHYRLYGTFERPDMVSRVGFPVAYNYRTNKFRFFWIER